MSKQDRLFEELAALGTCELDEAADQRIRSRAKSLFVRCAREPQTPWMQSVAHAWRAEVEPAFVVAGSVGFLVWAMSAVVALY